MIKNITGEISNKKQLSGKMNVSVGGYYADLPDKPKINGVELVGDMTSKQLGLVDQQTYATNQEAGVVKVGENLKIYEGVLSVETTNDAEEDNTKPMTSAGVYVELGNINILLSKIQEGIMAEQTNIANQISRIQTDRDTIRTKLVELGMAQSTDNLDKLATAVSGITNQGAVSVEVTEGDTYTIPKGYHNGSGTVSGVAGGGNYKLQSKQVTPTKSQQNITPDSGFYGLIDVTVGAIPENYQDVSSVNATAGDVLTGKTFVDSTGKVTAGTMLNNGTVIKKLDTATKSYTIPKGYHSGTGSVSIDTETKTATPTKSQQTISPTTGKVLQSVTVAPIPSDYITTDDATATASQILSGATAYVDGTKVTGSMKNNGSVSKTIDGLTTASATIPAGYTTGGTISLTSDIEDALSAI